MANVLDSVDRSFATNLTSGPVPRWQRKAMEAIQTPKKTTRKCSNTPQVSAGSKGQVVYVSPSPERPFPFTCVPFHTPIPALMWTR